MTKNNAIIFLTNLSKKQYFFSLGTTQILSPIHTSNIFFRSKSSQLYYCRYLVTTLEIALSIGLI
jgi:hypothetical protein